ncbi:MAG: hypothetical protein U0892_22655 [Pirellulales bacterium]
MQNNVSTSARRSGLRRSAFVVALAASLVHVPVLSAQVPGEKPQEERKPRTVIIEIQKRNPSENKPAAQVEPIELTTAHAEVGESADKETVRPASTEKNALDISANSPSAARPTPGEPPRPHTESNDKTGSSDTADDVSEEMELVAPAATNDSEDAKSAEPAVRAASGPRREPPRLSSEHPEKDVHKAAVNEKKSEPALLEKSSRHKVPDNKPKAASDLTIEEQQAEDEGECPGGNADSKDTKSTADDIPLEQESQPFDAPSAKSDKAIEPAPVTKRAQSVDPSVVRLQRRIDTCLAYYMTHPENLAKRSPWAVMHAILPYGVEGEIIAGNRKVNSIGWMCYNGVCKTQRMFQPTTSGFRTNVGAGVQGHEGQFLAVLAQSGVPKDFPIVVGQNRYKVNDLIRYEMSNCRENSELTFQLIGFAHYLPPNQTWRDSRGQPWNVEKMVGEELDQPIVGAACGGTHRLMGLSYAVLQRQMQGQPVTGHFARADIYLNEFTTYTWTLQNPDGSFSTDWFEGRANEPNMERKVQTTGHILEWLMFRLPDSELDDPRIRKAAEFLIGQIYDHRDHEWPIGPRSHSLRALALYQQRVGGSTKGQMKSYLAKVGALEMVR